MRIICVGRLSPEKGQLGLLDAFGHACERGLEASLVLVGDGPDRKRVEDRILRNGLKDRVTMLGRLPEARTLEEIAQADVLVLASFMEGLPVVLMEALALGVPVIAPAIAGIPELIAHGRTGLLFDAGDWGQLSERLVEISRDRAMRVRMAEAGRGQVEDMFSIARAVQPLFDHLTRTRTGGRPITFTATSKLNQASATDTF
jgi:glycosyltransferase involved in cell wall biosynthesis